MLITSVLFKNFLVQELGQEIKKKTIFGPASTGSRDTPEMFLVASKKSKKTKPKNCVIIDELTNRIE